MISEKKNSFERLSSDNLILILYIIVTSIWLKIPRAAKISNFEAFKKSGSRLVYGHLQQIHFSDQVSEDPLNLGNLQQNHLQLNQLQLLFATCSSTTYSDHLQRPFAAQVVLLQIVKI